MSVVGAKVLITGGFGFLGQQLCRSLISNPNINTGLGTLPIKKIVLMDSIVPSTIPSFLLGAEQAGIQLVSNKFNVESREEIDNQITKDPQLLPSVFHLASVMSGQGEENMDSALKVNLQGTTNLLKACAEANTTVPVRVVFSSSIAVFGAEEVARDETKHLPKTTYGATKAASELLVNDFTRRGLVDGRTARLPTVVVRPGLPNAAVTSCFSGVVREPLAGVPAVLPISSEIKHPISGFETIIKGFVTLHNAEGSTVGPISDRAVNLPAISLSLNDLKEATTRVASSLGISLGPVHEEIDPKLDAVVRSVCSSVDSTRAQAIGIPIDTSSDEIVLSYVNTFVKPQ